MESFRIQYLQSVAAFGQYCSRYTGWTQFIKIYSK